MPDQEAIKGQFTLLETLRRRLRIQIDQQRKMATLTPAYIQLEIDDAQAQIKKIKEYLRKNGQQVEDVPEDGGTEESDAADVFISYHPADKEWVRKQLLPLLEQQHGLRAIIDYRDFEIGVPRLVNIENAVANSRHTLIVMTPDWIANEWNSFQGLLAGSEDPSGVQAKLMPVMLSSAAIPSRLKFLEPTDLTDPEEREMQLERLIRSIKRSAGQPGDKGALKSQQETSSQAQSLNAGMPDSTPPPAFRDIKKRTLERRLNDLIAEYDAVTNQISSTLNDADRIRLKRQADKLEHEISQIDSDLRAL